MKIVENPMDGLMVLQPKVFSDNRGIFFESFSVKRYRELGIKDNFIQDNLSRSKKNVLRGMHFQKINPQAQLVTVIKGRIYDVCVDLRENSPTFSEWFAIELKEEGPNQIYMAPGFAHGFYVMSNYVDLHYKVTLAYDSKNEAGFIWNDSDISINWPISDDPILSQQDRILPLFNDSGVSKCKTKI